ncbi:MAG: alpha-amylase family protein [Spirochaetales bacterium]
MKLERSRQIHLDFHTSEDLPDIGAAFEKEQFQAALQLGHVNLINVFGKCHHSWYYYPTKVGRPHPNLKIDLLGSQIEACHEIDVLAPVYITGGWSATDAEEHPDWLMRDAGGEVVTSNPWPKDAQANDPKPTFQWKELCVSGEYHELIAATTEEICKPYDVDGMFFDIYRPHLACYCERCRNGMKNEHIDMSDEQSVKAYRAQTIKRHAAVITKIIQSHHPTATIYFNGVTAIERPENFRYRIHEINTKNDLEDLPTTWGGYDKFPLRAKIFHREHKPVVAMSGKFHTAWGEFGGFKAPEAVRYEAASMIAYGASCNFGDHLHPLGKMDVTTYKNIGHAYSYVEKIEEYGLGGLPASSLGFFASYELPADEGLARMLLEEQLDFDVVAPGDDFSRFETIVVPSHAGVLAETREQIAQYLAGGGKMLVLGAGALDGNGGTALECGARFLHCPDADVDYTLVGQPLRGVEKSALLRRDADLPESPFLNYSPALAFELGSDVELLATVEDAYFNRTYAHYCGHQNTPNKPGEVARPAAWRHGNVIVLAHALDRLYYEHGAKVHRDFFARALRMVHHAPMVEVDLPSAGRVSLLHQADERRYVAHLLYASPIERGRCVVIEDLPTMRDVRLRLRLPHPVKQLRLEPAGTQLEYREREGAIEAVVPEFSAHCGVVAEYE